jgi:outer membrane protein
MVSSRCRVSLACRARRALGGLAVGLCAATAAQAQAQADSAAPRTDLQGELGGAVFVTQSVVRGRSGSTQWLPYAYADAGRLYARVDTFGLRLLPLGEGHLELAGRLSFEGFNPPAAGPGMPAGISRRSNPAPVGLGTFQETPYGGFFLYAFHDFSSGGALFEATYAAELPVGRLSFYPELGVERRSARYLRQLYGVSPAEAAAGGETAYQPGASTWPVFSLTAELPLVGLMPLMPNWAVDLQMRRKWLDRATRDSPLVDRRRQDSGFLALAYHFD